MTEKAAEKPPAKASEKSGTARKRKAKPEAPAPRSRLRVGLKWLGRGLGGIAAFYAVLVLLFSFIPPPINLYQLGEAWRLGGVEKDWVAWEEIAPVMGRSVSRW